MKLPFGRKSPLDQETDLGYRYFQLLQEGLIRQLDLQERSFQHRDDSYLITGPGLERERELASRHPKAARDARRELAGDRRGNSAHIAYLMALSRHDETCPECAA